MSYQTYVLSCCFGWDPWDYLTIRTCQQWAGLQSQATKYCQLLIPHSQNSMPLYRKVRPPFFENPKPCGQAVEGKERGRERHRKRPPRNTQNTDKEEARVNPPAPVYNMRIGNCPVLCCCHSLNPHRCPTSVTSGLSVLQPHTLEQKDLGMSTLVAPDKGKCTCAPPIPLL